MKRSPDERVTRDVAREICQRQGLKAMLVGSIAPLGTHYVLALEAINAQTGDVLARAQKEAESKEQVLEALGRRRPISDRSWANRSARSRSLMRRLWRPRPHRLRLLKSFSLAVATGERPP